MNVSVVHIRDIKSTNLRIDASYHLSEGQSVQRLIGDSPYPLIPIEKASADIFYGNRAKRVYVSKRDRGIPFLSSSDILQADLENVKLASKKYTPCIDQMRLKKGWTLISRSGTIGNCAFANAKHAQKLASEDVIRVVPNNILREGIIYAFLASKYGHSLLTQGTFGAVIQHIEPSFVGAIQIPIFPSKFQEEVDLLMQNSARLSEEATDALYSAVKYFNQRYSTREKLTKSFTKKIHELALGFAAYNNNIEVEDFVKQYRDNSFVLNSAATKIFAPPMFKHIYLKKDNGYPFMTGSELTKFNLRYYRWLSPKGVKDINDYVVKQGTLLLYKSGTTDGGILGNVFIADKAITGCCLSDHVIRIVFSEISLAYWTFAFLRSKGGIRLLQSLATGTMIPFITPERLSKILIPSPDNQYDEIVQLVSTYIEKNSMSKAMENQAITMVEQEIEKWNK